MGVHLRKRKLPMARKVCIWIFIHRLKVQMVNLLEGNI